MKTMITVFEARPGWSHARIKKYGGIVDDLEEVIEKLERLRKEGLILAEDEESVRWIIFGDPSAFTMCDIYRYLGGGEIKETTLSVLKEEVYDD